MTDLISDETRRAFLKKIASATGALVIAPISVGCGGGGAGEQAPPPDPSATSGDETSASADPLAIPQTKPADWDPISFNRDRGNAGAIPESYREQINGPDGEMKHLGKHLPYVVSVEGVPAGYIALMWGDPSKGHAKHPNAVPTEENPEGHWYNWIKLRKAVDGDATELESTYSAWPTLGDADNGKYAAEEGTDPSADDGKNTVYLAALPEGVSAGDTLRVYAHCKTHGEYVDFITLA